MNLSSKPSSLINLSNEGHVTIAFMCSVQNKMAAVQARIHELEGEIARIRQKFNIVNYQNVRVTTAESFRYFAYRMELHDLQQQQLMHPGNHHVTSPGSKVKL